MNKELNKKAVVITSLVIIAVFSFIYFVKNGNVGGREPQVQSKELPLRVDAIDVKFNIIQNNNTNVLEITYKNNSNEDISRLSMDLKFKDTGEVVTANSNELVKAGGQSSMFTSNAPNSLRVEDVEIVKYKISTLSGTYMEYDVELKQYNWS